MGVPQANNSPDLPTLGGGNLTLEDAATALLETERTLRRTAAEEYLGLVQYLYLVALEEDPTLTPTRLTLEVVEQRNSGRLLRKVSGALAALTGSEPKTVRASLVTAVNLYQHAPQLLHQLHAGTVSRATVQTAAHRLKSFRLPDPKKQPDGQPWQPEDLKRATTEILDGKSRLGRSLVQLAGEELSEADFATRAADEAENYHPQNSADRHRAARARRHVRITACADGMGRLELYDAAETIRRIGEVLSAGAQRGPTGADDEGTGRTRTQREADVLTDLILGGENHDTTPDGSQSPASRSRPTVFVMTSLTDFCAAGGHASEEFHSFLTQHFPHLSKHVDTVPAASVDPPRFPSLSQTRVLGSELRPHAQALAATLLKAAVLHVIITDPATGYPIGVGGQYRPPPIVQRLLALRDQHCRYPGCRAPASVCETDHVHPFAESGQTAYSNLALWCKEHHTGKTARWWEVSALPEEGDGVLQIRDKGSGQRHISQPPLPLHPAAWADHQQRQDHANEPPF